MGITRRTALGGSAALLADTALGGPKPDATVVDVSGKDLKLMVAKALEALGGIKAFVRPGDYVVLKPNAAFANPPAWATTTSPELVVAVAKLCLEAKAKQVLVLEFPQAKAEKCLERCGLTAALAEVPQVKVKVLTSAAEEFQKVEVKDGVALKQVEVAKALRSADVFINLPVAKQHNDCGVSFGLKNHMGLIRERKPFHTELNIHQAVADLGRVIAPQLTVLDATRALLTNGPTGPGETETPGRIVAGRSVVSVDAYALGLAQYNRKSMRLSDAPHIELAGKAGLGETDVSKLQVKKLTA